MIVYTFRVARVVSLAGDVFETIARESGSHVSCRFVLMVVRAMGADTITVTDSVDGTKLIAFSKELHRDHR